MRTFRKALLTCIFLVNGFLLNAQKEKNIPVIFDTDMGPDYDDVGAITMLHAFADSGYINLLGTVASTKYEGVAGVLNVFNTYFNRPDIPIGVPKVQALELKDPQHWTDSILLKYPHKIKKNTEVPDAVEVYRKLLAASADKTVTIITVGFLTNLDRLLRSGPDQYSPMDGKKLVKRKVKQLVCMGGKFPSGVEFNVEKDAPASINVFKNWVTPVLLSGFEIGQEIRTGLPLIENNSIRDSPVKDVFSICIPKAKQDSAGRMSWDETAVLVAVKGYKPWYTVERGKMDVHADGSNSWSLKPHKHSRLVKLQSPVIVQELINNLIMHQPVNKRP